MSHRFGKHSLSPVLSKRFYLPILCKIQAPVCFSAEKERLIIAFTWHLSNNNCNFGKLFKFCLYFCRIKEAEDTFASREKDYQAQLEEFKQFEQKAKNKIREMENLLEQTTFDRENYKAQLSGNDGRISALESQIARIEAAKNDSEFKLSSLYSILRRSLGLRSQSRPPTPNEGSPKKNRRSFRGRSRSSSGKQNLDFTCMTLLLCRVEYL